MGQLFTRLPGEKREAALHFIRNQVVQNCVVIFSKSYCPYCMKAKSIFEEIGANFKAIELDHRKDGDHIQNILEELTGVRTVPRVFVNGKCIGGATDTHKLHSNDCELLDTHITKAELRDVKWLRYTTHPPCFGPRAGRKVEIDLSRASTVLERLGCSRCKSLYPSSTPIQQYLDRSNRMGGVFSGPQMCQSYTDATAFQIIHDTITKNRVVIFSKTTCPYCDIVKNIFADLGIPYKAVELDLRNDGVHLQCILTEMTGIKTVPKVFINGTCIGGGSDTVLLHSKGRLLDMVNECGPNSAVEGACILL